MRSLRLGSLAQLHAHTGNHRAAPRISAATEYLFAEPHELPVGLYQNRMAHADVGMSDGYDTIRGYEAFRLQRAEKRGIGFELPSNVPKNEEIDALLEEA